MALSEEAFKCEKNQGCLTKKKKSKVARTLKASSSITLCDCVSYLSVEG